MLAVDEAIGRLRVDAALPGIDHREDRGPDVCLHDEPRVTLRSRRDRAGGRHPPAPTEAGEWQADAALEQERERETREGTSHRRRIRVSGRTRVWRSVHDAWGRPSAISRIFARHAGCDRGQSMSSNAPTQARSRATLASFVMILVSGSVSAHATPTPVLPATSTSAAASANATAQGQITPTAERDVAPELNGTVPTPTPEIAPDPFARDLAGGRIVSGLASHRALHFTFDDGPSEHTPALLDALDAHGVRATFFLVARQLEHERGRRIARQIVGRGHTVGLHSYRHDDLTTLDAAALRRDLDRSERIYEDVFEARPWLFRPPYGRHSEAIDLELASRGYTEVLWNITTSDGHARSADEVVEGFREALDRQERMPRGAGGVVVFHDTHRWVVEAMPRIFEEIEARNCELAASDEELWDVHEDLGAWYEARGRAAATRSARRMRLDEETQAARQAALRARTQCDDDVGIELGTA